jgi:formate hydrogenlyase transcriptional activator
VLRRTGGQVAGKGGAAEILGLPPSTLRSRMAKLGLTGRTGQGSRRLAVA